MALTVSLVRQHVKRGLRERWFDITFDDSYLTGGEALTPATLGLRVALHVSAEPDDGYVFKYDYANEKLLAYRAPGFTPEGSVAAPTFTGSALAAHTHALHFNNADVADSATTAVNVGTNLMGANTGTDIAVAGVADTSGAGGIVAITGGTPAGTNSAPAFTGTAVAAAALVEVANAVDLSAVIIRLYANGK